MRKGNLSPIYKWLLPILTGILLFLSFPPFHTNVLAYFAVVPFLFLLYKLNYSGGFKFGYISGIVFNLGVVHWLAFNSGAIPSISVIAMFAAVLFLALNFALFGWIISILGKRIGDKVFWTVPFIWTSIEYVRTFGTLGFPWISLSNTQTYFLPSIQIASITGIYGITFWILLINVLISQVIILPFSQKKKFVWIGLVIGVFLLSPIYGWFQLSKFAGGYKDYLKVAGVQPNVDPNDKWDYKFREYNFNLLDSLSLLVENENLDLLVWPETATPAYIRHRSYYLQRVKNLSRRMNVPILTGAPDYDKLQGKYLYYNAAFYIQPDSDSLGVYYKNKLVPFGEYVPLSRWFPALNDMNLGQGNFIAGTEKTVFYLNSSGKRFGALICYESIFPQISRAFIKNGADFLVIITNDGWFGTTSGPHQHSRMSILRAIENRIPIVRAANTGISMIIDPYGRELKTLPLNTMGVMMDKIPFIQKPSFYARFGDLFAILNLVITGVILGGVFFRR
jgi:apolipoprotein N-acyltransferase